MKKELTLEERRSVRQVKESAGDASLGLPEEIFELTSSLVPMVNVDLLCQDELGRILMVWREDTACGCGWHLPGGIIRFKETIEKRIVKTAQNELGVAVQFDELPVAIHEFIFPQEIRGHFISFLYRCFLPENYPHIKEASPEKCCKPGDMRWHRLCPRQWVKGQREAYASLFRTSLAEQVSAHSSLSTVRKIL